VEIDKLLSGTSEVRSTTGQGFSGVLDPTGGRN